jgi:uncharacterized coiled-coil DUF342 family protein
LCAYELKCYQDSVADFGGCDSTPGEQNHATGLTSGLRTADNPRQGNLYMTEKVLSPQEVRKILNADNKEIVELCRRAAVSPRKNDKGQTYFSYDEVQHLRKIQNNHSLPAVQEKQSALVSVMNALKDMETSLSGKIAKVIDEKLEGMDEVVVELIRCKTDNETLRQKIVDMNKEIYRLKNDLNSYKPVAMGFYKKKHNTWE